jgi:DNA-binding response OmpR family regulator
MHWIVAPRVLVVESSREMQEVLELHLGNAGYDVATAPDDVAAGQMLLERRPDLMIVDADTGCMNPYDFVAMLSADPAVPFFPIIVLTFSDHAEDSAALAGAAACIRMPVSAKDLLAVVAEHLMRNGSASPSLLH